MPGGANLDCKVEIVRAVAQVYGEAGDTECSECLCCPSERYSEVWKGCASSHEAEDGGWGSEACSSRRGGTDSAADGSESCEGAKVTPGHVDVTVLVDDGG